MWARARAREQYACVGLNENEFSHWKNIPKFSTWDTLLFFSRIIEMYYFFFR